MQNIKKNDTLTLTLYNKNTESMKDSEFTTKIIDTDKDPFCLNLSLIANTLLILERNVLWIGIPFLPALQKKLDPPIEFFYPLSDFIRATLVTIPSKDLISARDILSSKGEDSREAEYFLSKFRTLSIKDYIYFPLLTSSVIFILTLTSIFPFINNLPSALTISFLTSLGGTLGSLLFYLENLRFFSFIKILDNEILRRSGKSSNRHITPIPRTAFSRSTQAKL